MRIIKEYGIKVDNKNDPLGEPDKEDSKYCYD
jgi:hypothetical protein